MPFPHFEQSGLDIARRQPILSLFSFSFSINFFRFFIIVLAHIFSGLFPLIFTLLYHPFQCHFPHFEGLGLDIVRRQLILSLASFLFSPIFFRSFVTVLTHVFCGHPFVSLPFCITLLLPLLRGVGYGYCEILYLASFLLSLNFIKSFVILLSHVFSGLPILAFHTTYYSLIVLVMCSSYLFTILSSVICFFHIFKLLY